MIDPMKVQLVERKCKRKRCTSTFKVMEKSPQLHCSTPCRESETGKSLKFGEEQKRGRGRPKVNKEDDENETD